MKKAILMAGLILMSTQTWAAKLSCADLKEKIETKLAGKGVKNYSLEVVGKDAETSDRVVGRCDGDVSKIVYKREKKQKEEKAG
jgi:hypothetical protein